MKNQWKHFHFNLKGMPMNIGIIEDALNAFFADISLKVQNTVQEGEQDHHVRAINNMMLIQFKIQLSGPPIKYRSVTKVQVVPLIVEDDLKSQIYDLFADSWLECGEYYHSLEVKSIVISHREIKLSSFTSSTTPQNTGTGQDDRKAKLAYSSRLKTLKQKPMKTFIGKTNLPLTLNLEKWGVILKKNSCSVSSDTDIIGEEYTIQSKLFKKTIFIVKKYCGLSPLQVQNFIVSPTYEQILPHACTRQYDTVQAGEAALEKSYGIHEVEVKVGPFTKYKFIDIFTLDLINTSDSEGSFDKITPLNQDNLSACTGRVGQATLPPVEFQRIVD